MTHKERKILKDIIEDVIFIIETNKLEKNNTKLQDLTKQTYKSLLFLYNYEFQKKEYLEWKKRQKNGNFN